MSGLPLAHVISNLANREVSREADTMHRSADGCTFMLRPCTTLDEIDSCVALQQQTWGYSDAEVVPRAIYVLAQALGGHVFGAWDEQDQLAGFAMAIAAHEPAADSERRQWMRPIGLSHDASLEAVSSSSGTLPGKLPNEPYRARPVGTSSMQTTTKDAPVEAPTPYLHSHMLAVAEKYRNCGLGLALKLRQRQEALRCGINMMRWTFDPLVAKNAFFNLRRLGATARCYIPNFYGQSGLTQQDSLPTDRLLAEWRLDGERTHLAIKGKAGQEPASNKTTFYRPTGKTATTTTKQHAERIDLPATVAFWRRQGAQGELEAAQCALRKRFQDAFARGLEVDDFVSMPDGGGEYLLTRFVP